MGNLRQKYTDEEWDELEKKAKRNNEFRKQRVEEERESKNEAYRRLDAGRHYLMSVDSKKLTVEDCLEAFGFSRNGIERLTNRNKFAALEKNS